MKNLQSFTFDFRYCVLYVSQNCGLFEFAVQERYLGTKCRLKQKLADTSRHTPTNIENSLGRIIRLIPLWITSFGVLFFLIECTTEDSTAQYKTLVNELESFNKEMLKKPQIVAITKMDLADGVLRKKIKKIPFRKGIPVVPISAVSGEGLKELIDVVWKKLQT